MSQTDLAQESSGRAGVAVCGHRVDATYPAIMPRRASSSGLRTCGPCGHGDLGPALLVERLSS